MLKLWLDEVWENYLWWQTQDKKTLRRIDQGNRIIFAMEGDTVFFYSLRDQYTR